MVYSGKPSSGCNTCRKRRIKCDEAQPTCGQCQKSNRVCLGYRDTSELIFRDQTDATEQRVVRRTRVRDALASWKPGLHVNRVTLTSVPPSLSEDFERQAFCFFLEDYVLVPRHVESVRGYMGLLVPVYTSAKEGSALHPSIIAISLAALSHKKRSVELFLRSRASYGRACTLLKEAIADPVQAKSNDTLMTVLMLGQYDTIAATRSTLLSWGTHIDGAAALIENRGKANMMSSAMNRTLYWAVTSQSLINHIVKCEPMKPYLDWTDLWSQPTNDEGLDHAGNRLCCMGTRLPALRSASMRWLHEPMNAETLTNVLRLKANAKALDEYIATWPGNHPESWRVTDAGTTEGQEGAVEDWEFWPGTYHGYYDIWVTNVWNNYRIIRLFCNYIVFNCWERLLPASELDQVPEVRSAKVTIQHLVDDICASVPYLLGHSTPFYDAAESVVYTNSDEVDHGPAGGFKSKPDIRDHRKSVEALGGYFVSWPLFVAVSCRIIPRQQRHWIKGRLIKIGAKYGIRSASILGAVGAKPDFGERAMTIIDLHPPPFTELPPLGGVALQQLGDADKTELFERDDFKSEGWKVWGKTFTSRLSQIGQEHVPAWDSRLEALDKLDLNAP